jgi:hypothetical protein
MKEDKSTEFVNAIEEWVSSKFLARVDPPKEIEAVINADFGEMQSWSQEACYINAFRLYAYSEYLAGVKAKEKIVFDWAEGAIWFIIGSTLDQYGDGFTKWEKKYYCAVKENPLATKILKVKNHAQARISSIDGKQERMIKMADTLNNMARRK